MAELQFIQLSSSGITIDDPATIRSKIIDRYREAYGSDIDITTGTADGMFVELMSQMVWNAVRAVHGIYTNLSIATATGAALDNLCSLANVVRQSASRSRASVTLTNLTANALTYTNLQLFDKSGQTWTIPGTITIPANGSITEYCYCDKLGAIDAPANWIYSTVELLDITVSQTNPAILGHDDETDEELKARKAQSNGGTGTTVIESLTSALLDLNGVEQAYTLTNNTSSNFTADDSVVIAPGSVYVMVKATQMTDSLVDNISQTIFEKLTPGILTALPGATSAVSIRHSDNCYDNLQTSSFATTVINWKECLGIDSEACVVIEPNERFASTTLWAIANAIAKAVNQTYLGHNLDASDVMNAAFDADPLYYGRRTYATISAVGANSNCNFLKPLGQKAAIWNGTIYDSNDDESSYTLIDGVISGPDFTFTYVPTGSDDNFSFVDEDQGVSISVDPMTLTFTDPNDDQYRIAVTQYCIWG